MKLLSLTATAVVIAASIALIPMISANTPGYVTATFPYKVTVTIAHQGQAYSGAKVWSIRAWAGTSLTALRQARWSVVGEAIPIDAGDLGRVYFLKRSASNVSTDTFGGFVLNCDRPPNEKAKLDIIEYVESLPTFYSPCSVVQFEPMFVSAGADAKSVEYVPIPWGTEAHCVDTCVLSVVVETTDEAVTTGIVDDLPWLKLNVSPTAIIGEPERRSTSTQSAFPPYYRQDFINERYERAP